MSLVSQIFQKFTSCNPPFINLPGFMDEEFCDVTVNVSHDDLECEMKSYKLHRNVLAGCSLVLHQSLIHQRTIDITYMSPTQFELLVIFMYTGEMCFKSVSELCFGLYAANLLKLNGLVNKCVEGLLNKLVEDSENALLILQSDKQWNNRSNNVVLFECVDETIEKNYAKVLSSDIINKLEHKTMKHLLQMESISDIQEIDVFNALLKWTIAHCNESESPRELRDVAGELIYLIRYNLIPFDVFGKIVARSELVPPELIMKIVQRLCDDTVDVPFCTRVRQKWNFLSTCTSLEHSVEEVSQWSTNINIVINFNGKKVESEWLSLPVIENTKTRWAVKFNLFPNDDLGIKICCLFLENRFRAASIRLFAVVKDDPPMWSESTAIVKSDDPHGWNSFSKKLSKVQIEGPMQVFIRLQWTELDEIPFATNLWMNNFPCLCCRWHLQDWKACNLTSSRWSLSSKPFGINGALWTININSSRCASDRKLMVRVILNHFPASANCIELAMNCSLSLWDQQFDEKKQDMKEMSKCQWKVISNISLESRANLNLCVNIRITPKSYCYNYLNQLVKI